MGVGVAGIDPDAALQHGNRIRNPAELSQADAPVARDVRVVEHTLEDIEQRQRVLEEAMLQQAEHVLLGFDTRFGTAAIRINSSSMVTAAFQPRAA